MLTSALEGTHLQAFPYVGKAFVNRASVSSRERDITGYGILNACMCGVQ